MSATQEQIAASNYPEYFIHDVAGQLQTRQAAATYDDSYMGLWGWGGGGVWGGGWGGGGGLGTRGDVRDGDLYGDMGTDGHEVDMGTDGHGGTWGHGDKGTWGHGGRQRWRSVWGHGDRRT